MKRVTLKCLHREVDRLNREHGRPEFPYRNGVPCKGCFFIDYDYGGVALYMVSNKKGGAIDVFGVGHVPKREIFEKIKAYHDLAFALK